MKKSLLLPAVLAAASALPVPLAVLGQNEESRFLANVTQITNSSMGFANAGEAYFSPDGASIVFQATPIGEGAYQIFTMALSTSKPVMVSTGKGACTCAYFRPDGRKIIFASSHLDPDLGKKTKEKPEKYKWDFDPHMDIFEADPDGKNLIRLTISEGYDAEGSYSPDGRTIVFTSQRDGDLEIYVMDHDGRNQRRITNGKGYDGGPFLSPDGKTIAYRGDRRGDDKQNLQLRLVDATGANDRSITDNALFNWSPFWLPDAKAIIFTQADHAARSRNEPVNYDLFLIKPDGSALTRITFDPAFDGLPVMDAAGKKIMWTSRRGGLSDPQIFLADFVPPDAFR